MSFISGRLIGTKLNLFKQASALCVFTYVCSVLVLYLRYQDESVVGVDRYFG